MFLIDRDFELRIFISVVALAIFGFVSEKSFAEPISENFLYDACSNSEDYTYTAFCVGYISGQVEGQQLGAFSVLDGLEPSESTNEANHNPRNEPAHTLRKS